MNVRPSSNDQAMTSPVMPADCADYVCKLGDTSDRNHGKVASLGGKGARLAHLIAAGLPVPPAFCLTTELFDRFITETGVGPRLTRASSREAREIVFSTELPPALTDAVLAAYHDMGSPRVAVRSSAPGEDSADRSFAGQHDTVLDVGGDAAVIKAIKQCWASVWSERASAYRTKQPGRTGHATIAVVVQEMVNADVSGVLFTIDPVSGREHRIVIEACPGLGEGLVSGRVPSDFFVVDDRTKQVVEEVVRYKPTRCTIVGPGRIGMAKVDPQARNLPCLSHAQLSELIDIAQRLRDDYSSEQDIEWAFVNCRLWLLQARPITTRIAEALGHSPFIERQPDHIQQGTLWSRLDTGEIFVGQMTPLGLSFARYHQKNVHGDCGAALGLRDTGNYVGYMGYLHGHVYLNVSYSAYLLSQCPPMRNQRHFTARYANEEVDLEKYTNPYGTFPRGMEDLKSVLHWLRHMVIEMVRMKRRAEAMTASRLREFDRARAIDLSRMDKRELSSELSRYLAHYYDTHVGYLPYYINAFSAYGILANLCTSWLGEEGAALQNRIKADMSNLRTVATAREVWNIAKGARANVRALQLIRDTPLEGIGDALRADPDGAMFWDEHIEPFLRMNGVRGRQEMELTNPRWVDDPSYLFQMIRLYAKEGSSIDAMLDRNATVLNNTDAVLAGLSPAKRLVIERVLWLYTTLSELREVARMAMITPLWTIRRLVYELGRRLVRDGVLANFDEIAYLDVEDVRAYLGGTISAHEVFTREKIQQARLLHAYHKRLPEPPLSFIGECDIEVATPRPRVISDVAGLGASPGQVVARARIIEDLVWQADEFEIGEIVVTRYTDASWTPLFAIAGGIVTDVGSMLSHSSIVAREFGIPSVTNTKNATELINTGDLISVDGTTGAVEILERSCQVE